jgi:hypothetical protein
LLAALGHDADEAAEDLFALSRITDPGDERLDRDAVTV